MSDMTSRGFDFLKVVFGKYSVSDEYIIGTVIEELKRTEVKIKKGLERAIEKLCLALPRHQSRASDELYEQCVCLTKENFFSTERLGRILALKIAVASIIMRYTHGHVTEENASRDVISWLKTINIEIGGGGIMPCIQNTKPTVMKKTRKLMRRQSSKIIHQIMKEDIEIKIYLEFVKLAAASMRMFSNPYETNRNIVIKIPSRSTTAAPYSISAGALFMNLASYILEKHLCYEYDTQYFIKELTQLKDLMEFVVNTLLVPHIDGWRSREHDNGAILKNLQRKRFIRRSVSEEYINKRKRIKISKGEWVEVVECNPEELTKESYMIRRDKTETPFPVPPSCFNSRTTTMVIESPFYSVADDEQYDKQDVTSHTLTYETSTNSTFLIELKCRLQNGT